MKKLIFIYVLILYSNCFTQTEKISVSLGFQYSVAKQVKDDLSNSFDENYPVNFPIDSFDNKFGHRIETRNMAIPTIKIGCNAPILTYDKFSLGLDGAIEFGLAFESKSPTVEYIGFKPYYKDEVYPYTLDFTFGCNLNFFSRFYLNRKFEKIAYISPFLGFRYLNTIHSVTMPDFGVGFGQKAYELKFHCHFTKIQYFRELVNVKKEIYEEYSFPFSVSFLFHLGSDDF